MVPFKKMSGVHVHPSNLVFLNFFTALSQALPNSYSYGILLSTLQNNSSGFHVLPSLSPLPLPPPAKTQLVIATNNNWHWKESAIHTLEVKIYKLIQLWDSIPIVRLLINPQQKLLFPVWLTISHPMFTHWISSNFITLNKKQTHTQTLRLVSHWLYNSHLHKNTCSSK